MLPLAFSWLIPSAPFFELLGFLVAASVTWIAWKSKSRAQNITDETAAWRGTAEALNGRVDTLELAVKAAQADAAEARERADRLQAQLVAFQTNGISSDLATQITGLLAQSIQLQREHGALLSALAGRS